MNVEQPVEWVSGMGNRSTHETCPSAALSTTDPMWNAPGMNPGRHGEKPTTNRLSYSTAERSGLLLKVRRPMYNLCTTYVQRSEQISWAWTSWRPQASNDCVRFEVFTAVTMKNGVFWVVTPCGSCKNRRFGGTWRLLQEIPSISSQRTSVASCSLCCS
jgi:hypothetical protein